MRFLRLLAFLLRLLILSGRETDLLCLILDKFKKLYLVFHTVRYLKFRQIFYRTVRSFYQPYSTKLACPEMPKRPNGWYSFPLYKQRIKDDFEATFLNQSRILNFPSCWNDPQFDKLWLYNLHYFEDVLSDTAKEREQFHLQLIHMWIEQNPPEKGIGWEPYTISLRVTNILKAWAGGLPIDDRIARSLNQQVDCLSRKLEKHLLGNHYFANLKALLFAGVIFENKRWIKIASAGLREEIHEQVLNDGMHFELTPMYHRLALVDMLDLRNLAQAFPRKIPSDLVQLIKAKINSMILAMEVMTHPDQGVAFFNDSVEGIAPSFRRIKAYAATLGFQPHSSTAIKPTIKDLSSCGYMAAEADDAKLIFDAAAVGPDYIPGHAHADTLSFEMSIGQQRVFVNSGISEYNVGPVRYAQRSTISHNTVEVDKRNSSEVWSSFRVAKRAGIVDRKSRFDKEKCWLSGSHSGYKSLFGGVIHRRNLTLSTGMLTIEDDLIGEWGSAVARFYFHPFLRVEKKENTVHVRGNTFQMTADLSGLDVRILDTKWYPEFGLVQINQCLEIDYVKAKNRVVFFWERI